MSHPGLLDDASFVPASRFPLKKRLDFIDQEDQFAHASTNNSRDRKKSQRQILYGVWY
jgi:hypothetical protein